MSKRSRVRPNFWYTDGPSKDRGTSLAWFANATSNYGEEGSISQSSGNLASVAASGQQGAGDVTGQRTDADAAISVAEPTGADNQGWYFRSTAQVPLGGSAAMPQTVTPYYPGVRGSRYL